MASPGSRASPAFGTVTLPPVVSPPSVTVVPGGGVNANWRASGVAKSTAVKPTSNAGLASLVE